MTERIAGDLEPIEVNEHDGELLPMAPSYLDGVIDRLAEHYSIRQSGKVVVGSEKACAGLSFSRDPYLG
jgi:hypothetical protein